MTEENPSEIQTPEPAAKTEDTTPQMSAVAALGHIFIEPGRVFEDMRRKPRFLLAGILSIMLIMLFQVVFIEKIGLETIARARIEQSSRMSDIPKEQKEIIIQGQSGTMAKVITYVSTPLVLCIFFVIGSLIYWLGANAMGGSARFPHALSVWFYSMWPQTLLFTVANLIVLFVKSSDDIDVTQAQEGLIKAGPAMLIDGAAHPVIQALVSPIDIFQIIGWVLAAIGLQKVAKISAGAAWVPIVLLALFGVAVKVLVAVMFK